MEKEIIEKYEKIINENKYINTFIFILYNMSCHDNYEKLDTNNKYEIMGLIYDIYMKDESRTDLSAFSDTIMSNYELALNGEITKYNIYEYMD